MDKKFDPKEFEKLKKPERLDNEDPEVIWREFSLKADSTFIDVGCGVGFAVIPFAKKIQKGIVYACDISEEMIKELEKELEYAGVQNVKTVKMEEINIPLPDAMADGVLMQNLYHELDQEIENLKECGRLLKPGGRLIVIDWKPMETPGGPPVEIRVESKKIEEDLIEAGFNYVSSLDLFKWHSFVVAEKE